MTGDPRARDPGPELRTVLARMVREEAMALGFSHVGIVRAEPSRHLGALRAWIAQGLHGDMDWIARDDAVDRRASGAAGWTAAASIVVVAHDYHHPDPPGVPDDPSIGVIARYARGRDYHRVVEHRLRTLLAAVQEGARARGAPPVTGRAYVDTGPLLERELGQRAGLGWFGRNTMLIHPSRGSYFFLGALLLDIELDPDPPFEADHCGSCTRCVDACPTGALLGRDDTGAPVIDARRCISYLTIEHRGVMPAELRPLLGNRVFGCDICQEVCPWSAKFGPAARGDADYSPRPDLDAPSLMGLTDRILSMSGKQYLREFADSPLARPGRKGMLRNLIVALGNWGDAAAVTVLKRALADTSPLVRAHAVWALRRIASPEAQAALTDLTGSEQDPLVRAELAALPPGTPGSRTA